MEPLRDFVPQDARLSVARPVHSNIVSRREVVKVTHVAAFGSLGVTQPTFVDAQPLQFSDQAAREQALERARTELAAVAARWAAAESSQDQQEEAAASA
jgi:hypothetical protein